MTMATTSRMTIKGLMVAACAKPCVRFGGVGWGFGGWGDDAGWGGHGESEGLPSELYRSEVPF